MSLDLNELETPEQETKRLVQEKKSQSANLSNKSSSVGIAPDQSTGLGIKFSPFDPFKQNEDKSLDVPSTVANVGADVLGGFGIYGLGQGLKNRVANIVGGVSPAVKVQKGDLELRKKQAEHDMEMERRKIELQEREMALKESKIPSAISPTNIAPVVPNPTVPTTPQISAPTTPTPQPSTNISPQSTSASEFALGPQVANTTPNVGVVPPTPSALLPEQKTPAQQAIEQVTETAPKPTVPPTMPMGEIAQNPVQSGEGTSPLHEPGQASGATQLEATQASTGVAQPKANTAIPTESSATETNEKPTIKGAAVPRRSKQEVQVAKEEMPYNKYYNQIANRLAGTENLREHPHITEQFDKAWEDIFHNVLGGKMEKSQGGAPSKIHEIEAHINANAEKYPDLVKYMNEAKSYSKGGLNPKEGGFSHLGAMLGLLGAGGLGTYMLYRYGKPYQESMEKASKAMGEVSGTQDLGKANKAEELSPAMRKIFIKSGNANYRNELNEQLANEKEPGRIAELKRELEKIK